MNNKNRDDKEFVEAFERLFDISLVPASLDEADEVIRNAGINPGEFRNEIRKLTARLLSESPLNWRNQDSSEIEAARKSLVNIDITKKLSRHQILAKITSIQERFPNLFPEPMQLAHRHLKEQSEDDLAYLYQEMIFRVKQTGIEFDEEE